MKLKSFLKRLILIEEKIEVFNSSVNGEISIYEDLFGKKTMRIDKVSQSGELVDAIWRSAISEIANYELRITNCLILGLGCGGCAKLIARKWPEAKIIGVEIDPKVIEVGEKYFGLNKIKNLKIEVADAIKFIDPMYKIHNIKYDLIFIDVYLGQNFPKGMEKDEFLNGVKNLLADKGVAVFNRFYWNSEYRSQARDFEEKLNTFFPKVWAKKANYNLLIFCKKVDD